MLWWFRLTPGCYTANYNLPVPGGTRAHTAGRITKCDNRQWIVELYPEVYDTFHSVERQYFKTLKEAKAAFEEIAIPAVMRQRMGIERPM